MPAACEFSEFSYGFSLTRDYLGKGGGVRWAPVFPSLLAEGQKGGGFDVMLRFRRSRALFLQFKLSERVDHPRGGEWDLFGRPYLRFWLHTSNQSKQHNLLLALSRRGRVLYAAPEFLTGNELDDSFRAHRVSLRSAMFAPQDIGSLPDAKRHCVAYLPGSSFGWFCSSPLEVQNVGGERFPSLLEEIASNSNLPEITLDSAAGIARMLLVDVGEVLARDIREIDSSRFATGIDFLAHVASAYCGSVLVLVQADNIAARRRAPNERGS